MMCMLPSPNELPSRAPERSGRHAASCSSRKYSSVPAGWSTPALFDVLRHANHGHPRRLVAKARSHTPPDRVDVFPEGANERLVHDRHRRTDAVSPLERTASHDRDSHGFEIAARDRLVVVHQLRLLRRRRIVLDVGTEAVVSTLWRKTGHDRDALDARHGAEPIDQAADTTAPADRTSGRSPPEARPRTSRAGIARIRHRRSSGSGPSAPSAPHPPPAPPRAPLHRRPERGAPTAGRPSWRASGHSADRRRRVRTDTAAAREPKTTPVTAETSSVKPSTAGSMPMSATRGRLSG